MKYRIDIFKTEARVPVTIFYKRLEDALATYCDEKAKCLPTESVHLVMPEIEFLQRRVNYLEKVNGQLMDTAWRALSVFEKLDAIDDAKKEAFD